jgi:hypothetical protein
VYINASKEFSMLRLSAIIACLIPGAALANENSAQEFALRVYREYPNSAFTLVCQEPVSHRKVSYELPLAQWVSGDLHGTLTISDNELVAQPDGNLAEGIILQVAPLAAEVTLTFDTDGTPALDVVKLGLGRSGSINITSGVSSGTEGNLQADTLEFHFPGSRRITCSPFLTLDTRPGVIISN